MKKTRLTFYAFCSIALLTVILPGACTKAKTLPPLPEVICNSTISFSMQIAPMIEENCSGCHGVGAGTSPVLSNHAEIAQNSDAIIRALRGTPQLMPEGGPALADSLIQQFQCWLQQGAPNN